MDMGTRGSPVTPSSRSGGNSTSMGKTAAFFPSIAHDDDRQNQSLALAVRPKQNFWIILAHHGNVKESFLAATRRTCVAANRARLDFTWFIP